MRRITVRGARALEKLARRFSSAATRVRVFALVGDLGAGKTTFAKGMLRGLGVHGRVTSPTFLVIRKYRIRSGAYRSAYHLDLYRIKSLRGELRRETERILSRRDAIMIIEWAERARRFLPKSARWIRFSHGRDARERVVEI